MPRTISYSSISEFDKDLKRLLKRFSTLEDDIETAKKSAIELLHLKQIDNGAIFEIPSFCSEAVKVCKLKKFACRSLKGRGIKSGIRITYVYVCDSDSVIFIEIYFKGDKENEDKERIKEFLKNNGFS